MKFFKLESTKFTPGIILDSNAANIEFYGFSLPENAIEFYQPILNWLREYKVELINSNIKKEVNVLFKLVYFNSSSLRLILELFHVLQEIQSVGIKINLSWHYDSEDTQMAESGREMAEIANIPVNIVPIY